MAGLTDFIRPAGGAIAGWFLLGALASAPACGRPGPAAAGRAPIIDVHLHVFTGEALTGGDTSWWPQDLPVPQTTEDLVRETVGMLERHNIVKAFASSDLAEVDLYRAAAPERIIPSLMLDSGVSLASIEAWHRDGRLKALGEVVWQYEGLAPNDPSLPGPSSTRTCAGWSRRASASGSCSAATR